MEATCSLVRETQLTVARLMVGGMHAVCKYGCGMSHKAT